MSQRDSGYARQERDLYETPEWVTEALIPHLPRGINSIWEPACGSGKMVCALEKHGGYTVSGTDIFLNPEHDFLKAQTADDFDAIITNPPFARAKEFIDLSIDLMAPDGVVAMLLRTDYDHAKTRQHLFSKCALFAKKLVLTKRIVWFDRPGAAPSFNHAWFIWDHRHEGPPVLAYGPEERRAA